MKAETKQWSSRIAALFLFYLILSLGIVRAQNRSTAEIVGTVTDPSGASVPNASVKITNRNTGAIVQVATNQAGAFDAPYLDPGPYAVEFQAPGFVTLVRQGIEIQLDQTARVDGQLKLGAATQAITVVANATLLNTEDSQRGTNFNDEMIGALPTVGRDPSYFALLAPGTSTAQSNVYGVDPGRRSVNGSRAFSMSATINGASGVLPNSDNFVTLVPALSAVSEFNVLEDNYNAEYATGTSVLNIVTKSGTNQFHGSIFEFFQNNVLNARNFFAKSATPLRYNQPGGTIGGPVLHDKLFFFFSFQDTLNPSTSVTIDTVPTDAVRGGNFAGFAPVKDPQTGKPFMNNQIPSGRIDSVAHTVLSYWPEPNLPGNVNNFSEAAPQVLKTPIYDARVDYHLTHNNVLSGAGHVYLLTNNHTGSIPPPACYNSSERCGVQISHSQQLTLTDRWTLGPTKINAASFNFVRQYFNQDTPNQNQGFPSKLGLTTVPPNYFPYFTIAGAIPTSIGPGQHSGGAQNTFSYSDAFTWVRGSHILEFGGEVDRFQFNPLAAWASGTFGFNATFSGNGFADFLLGLPYSYSLNAQPNTVGARRTAFAAFAQDDYHITRSLTLNLGLRYEGQGAFSEVDNRLSNFDPSLTNPLTGTPGAILFATPNDNTLQNSHFKLFAPRVGLAWNLRPSWVVRASYGIFFVPISAQRNYNSTPPGYAVTESLQVTNLSSPTPIFQLSQGPPQYVIPTPADRTPSISNGQATSYYPLDAPQGYMQQWQVGVQKQLSGSMVAEVSYVGSKGTHLLYPRDLNQVPAADLGPGNLQLLRPYPQYQSITAYFNDANSNYNALQVQLTRRFSAGLTILANYTYSKSMDDCSLDLTTGGGCEYQNASLPSASYAASQFDQTHRGVIAGVYDLPFGLGRAHMNRGGVIDAFLGGWTTSESFSANSGFPFTVLASTPNPALSGNHFANVSGSPNVSDPTIAKWFNTSAYSNPSAFTFGNSGRDSLRGPGFWDVDFSVSKQFRIPIGGEDRTHLQLRGDFFNICNHPNFAQPNATVGSAAFGTITALAYSNTNNNPARQIQLGLVLSF
ncbi:MAG: TonB-dependent receptor domain-containing protein [Candidatus Acidiferrales bacterium]